MYSNKQLPIRKLSKTTNYDQVPDPVLSWVGSGFFSQYTISNTGQSGVFEPPPGWDGYNGEFLSAMVHIMEEQVNFQMAPINSIPGELVCGSGENQSISIHQRIDQ